MPGYTVGPVAWRFHTDLPSPPILIHDMRGLFTCASRGGWPEAVWWQREVIQGSDAQVIWGGGEGGGGAAFTNYGRFSKKDTVYP